MDALPAVRIDDCDARLMDQPWSRNLETLRPVPKDRARKTFAAPGSSSCRGSREATCGVESLPCESTSPSAGVARHEPAADASRCQQKMVANRDATGNGSTRVLRLQEELQSSSPSRRPGTMPAMWAGIA